MHDNVQAKDANVSNTFNRNEHEQLAKIDLPSIPVHNDTSRDNEGADHDSDPLRNNGRGSHEANSQNYAAETNGTHGIPIEEFQQVVLDQHNKYRTQMKANKLQNNNDLHEKAQIRAHAEANEQPIQLSNDYNENIFVVDTGDPSKITGEHIVAAWYEERHNYNAKNESSAPHFSQLIWKISKELGIGHAYNGQRLFVVALYKPPGNIRGQFPANVDFNANDEHKPATR
ncbi:unnamed protein product [Rotaria sordida]|uniref:SCP domain-containing protein n=1 Tax=Rotaria sordida TaxID=392033 RepID=A0A813YVG9_9BILA|nr:unnamed protein product [Rotaria sordida]CAF0909169.1 unnamed protein product [Rotaria sordida]CAF1075994.1 unnamed protein product [Rotaria sordida]CAF1154201.1 unnamed protein product [Rotaria sordida]CAF3866715.1 unnamed protein product [Rotaria sordida]